MTGVSFTRGWSSFAWATIPDTNPDAAAGMEPLAGGMEKVIVLFFVLYKQHAIIHQD